MRLTALLLPLIASGPTDALAQGIFVTEATYWAHCSARLAVEGSRAGSRLDATVLEALRQQARQRARSVRQRTETDEQLLGYASNMRAWIEERRNDPSFAPALENAAAQCRARLEEASG